ncbi:MAG: inorganic diphosphatase [Candidatus Nitrosopolaris sp.]
MISCRPVGVLLTEDQGGIEPKIIAVPLSKIDPTFSTILDINNIQENGQTYLKHFIEHHKDLEEGKYVKVAGWEGKDATKIRISEAIRRYNRKIDV